jgi:hypothetical protein
MASDKAADRASGKHLLIDYPEVIAHPTGLFDQSPIKKPTPI